MSEFILLFIILGVVVANIPIIDMLIDRLTKSSWYLLYIVPFVIQMICTIAFITIVLHLKGVMYLLQIAQLLGK